VSVSLPKQPIQPRLSANFEPRMLSFDVYGTLINTPPANHDAFRAILVDAGRSDLDPKAFYSFWEQRNIAHYYESYRTYKDICRLSLSEAYEKFGVKAGREEAIQRYFDCFSSMELYPDVLPTLDVLARTYKLALVSNIDDDLLGATRLGRDFDLVCTAERARGYKPGRHALPLPPGAIRAEPRAHPALRAVAVHRYGGRKAFGAHRRLDQQACSQPEFRSPPA
jgi:2-haloacid dehalogenase